jgi:hypothetical protein
MTRESKAREAWKDMLNMFGKGSPEEIKAYREYIKIRQGEDKGSGKGIKSRTIKKPKTNRTGDLEGMSFVETFDLQNPETEISAGLPQQCGQAQTGLLF